MGDHSRFAVFILTHGRPDNQRTVRALTKNGYTGPIYWLIDTDDTEADAYRDLYGDRVIVFDKAAEAERFDTMDLSTDRRTIVYARNASQRIAREMGLDYILQLDDDYNYFAHRFIHPDTGALSYAYIQSFDALSEAMLTFLDDTGAATVALAQGGDYMGGAPSFRKKAIMRKAMNSFWIDLTRPVPFRGRVNEDVNTYVGEGATGSVFLTVGRVGLEQPDTQSSEGGMTGSYRDAGTYVKSFYTVMVAPSCVTISLMGETSKRFHHKIRWDHAVPKIIGPHHRKAATHGE